MRKWILFCLCLSPSICFADRLGTLKNTADVALSTGAILNSPNSTESKTVNVTSASISTQLNLYDVDTSTPLVLTRTGKNRFDLDFISRSQFVTSDLLEMFASLRAGSVPPIWELRASTQTSYNSPDTSQDAVITLFARNSSFEPPHIRFSIGTYPVIDFSSGTVDYGSNYIANLAGISAGNLDVMSGTVGSETGKYNFSGTTITINAPGIDTLNRVPILNNGTLSWPTMANGAAVDTYNLFTASDDFNGAGGIGVKYGASVGSMTITGLNSNSLLYVNASTQVAAVTIGSNLTFSGGTLSATGGSGSQDFDLGDSTGASKDVQFSTNSLLNVKSVKFSNTYDSGGNQWIIKPSTYSHVPGGAAGSITFTGSSSHTVEGLQFWAIANSTFTGRFVLSLNNSSSNSGGYKFLMTGPASPVIFEMTGGGSGASATTSNFSQQAAALNTKTGTFLGTYTSNAAWFEFDFMLITGATPGYVNVQICPTSGAGNNFINTESYITAVQD